MPVYNDMQVIILKQPFYIDIFEVIFNVLSIVHESLFL